jgi:hypothetical protein
LPQLGALEIAAVSRDDLKRFVTLLDARAVRGFTLAADDKRCPFGWKSAVNVWAPVALFFPTRAAPSRSSTTL